MQIYALLHIDLVAYFLDTTLLCWQDDIQNQYKPIKFLNVFNPRSMRAWHDHTARQRSLRLTGALVKDKSSARLQAYTVRSWYWAYRANQLAQQMQDSLREKHIRKTLGDWKKYAQQCRSDKFRQLRLLRGVRGYKCLHNSSRGVCFGISLELDTQNQDVTSSSFQN